VRIEDNRLWILENYSQTKIPAGDEITAINGVESKTIIDNLYRYADGATKYSRLMDIQDRFPIQLWWVYDFQGPFKIKARDSVYTLDGMTSLELLDMKSGSLDQEAK
jgi:hypothetical protein